MGTYRIVHIYVIYRLENAWGESLSVSIKFKTHLLAVHACSKKRLLVALNNFLILFFIMVKFWCLMSVLTLILLISQYHWLHLITFKQEKSARNSVKLAVLQKGKLRARFIPCSQILPALKLMKRWFIRMRSIQPWHTEIQSSMYVLICHCL